MRIRHVIPLATIALIFVATQASAISAGLWEPVVITIPDNSIAAQPFDVDIVGTFTSPTSRVLTHWGYYAGNNTWAFRFLCDEIGTWTWAASSGNGSGGARTVDFMDASDNFQLTYDQQVDEASGSFECTTSSHPGQLDAVNKRWQHRTSGQYKSPMAFQTGYLFRNPTLYGETAQSIVDWYKANGATMLQTNLLILDRRGSDPYYFHTVEQGDRIYRDISFSNGLAKPDTDTFWLPTWDRMNEFFDLAARNNLGAFFRFYGDDADCPGPGGNGCSYASNANIAEGSEAEFRLFRYTMARLAAYPVVVWESGIDISEYRSESWVDNFLIWIDNNDPWQHPRASRNSPGWDSSFATHYSPGAADVPPFPNMASRWVNETRPTFWTDHWRSQHSCSNARGRWCVSLNGWNSNGGDCAKLCTPNGENPDDYERYYMRGMSWETAFVHGGTIVGNRKTSFSGGSANFTQIEMAGVIDPFYAGPDIKLRNDFLETLTDYGAMVPDVLLTNGEVYAASTGSGEYMFYVLRAQNGQSFTANLSSATGAVATARWYNTTSGTFQNVTDAVTSSGAVTLTPPSPTDWALHIAFGNASNPPPAPPTNLEAQ